MYSNIYITLPVRLMQFNSSKGMPHVLHESINLAESRVPLAAVPTAATATGNPEINTSMQ